MDVTLVAVGKLRPAFRAAADEYLKRLGRWARVTEVELKEASRAPTPDVGRAQEGVALLGKVPERALLVALAREGSGWTSVQLAREVDRWRLSARPVALAIGGSHGLAAEVLRRAQARWSLGPLTLPHELARVVVCEQLYRAFTILSGDPYHKGR